MEHRNCLVLFKQGRKRIKLANHNLPRPNDLRLDAGDLPTDRRVYR